MGIRSITISNYKATGPLTSLRIPNEGSLPDGIVLLVGINGSGKTTIANAIRLACLREISTSQYRSSHDGSRTGFGDPLHDFFDPSRPYSVAVEFDWPDAKFQGCVEVSCRRPGEEHCWKIDNETVPWRDGGPRVAKLKDRVFTSAWPRLLSELRGRAFNELPISNEEAYKQAWPRVTDVMKSYFGVAVGAPPRQLTPEEDALFSKREGSKFALNLVDHHNKPLHENSDGLAHLLYQVMEIEKHPWSTTFVMEEPDVYLHPRYQRQFLRYLQTRTQSPHRHQFIITTHSPYLMDFAGTSGPSSPQIFRLSTASHWLQCEELLPGQGWSLLGELGHRPSDVLQPNGIIWVEGPSDVIYLKLWMDAFAREQQQDIVWGNDVEILWYGGSLLSRVENTGSGNYFWATATEEQIKSRLNLLRTNPNAVMVIDRDNFPNDNGSMTKRRILKECNEQGIPVWMTQDGRKTIEDYLNPELAEELRISDLKRNKGKVEAACVYAATAVKRGLSFEHTIHPESDVADWMRNLLEQIETWRRPA